MARNKAQAATEMIIILALALIILLGIFVFNTNTLNSVNTELRIDKARTFVNDIGDSAELVYLQGVGSKTKIYISLPESINTSKISDKTISVHDSSIEQGHNFSSLRGQALGCGKVNTSYPLKSKNDHNNFLISC